MHIGIIYIIHEILISERISGVCADDGLTDFDAKGESGPGNKPLDADENRCHAAWDDTDALHDALWEPLFYVLCDEPFDRLVGFIPERIVICRDIAQDRSIERMTARSDIAFEVAITPDIERRGVIVLGRICFIINTDAIGIRVFDLDIAIIAEV